MVCTLYAHLAGPAHAAAIGYPDFYPSRPGFEQPEDVLTEENVKSGFAAKPFVSEVVSTVCRTYKQSAHVWTGRDILNAWTYTPASVWRVSQYAHAAGQGAYREAGGVHATVPVRYMLLLLVHIDYQLHIGNGRFGYLGESSIRTTNG